VRSGTGDQVIEGIGVEMSLLDIHAAIQQRAYELMRVNIGAGHNQSTKHHVLTIKQPTDWLIDQPSKQASHQASKQGSKQPTQEATKHATNQQTKQPARQPSNVGQVAGLRLVHWLIGWMVAWAVGWLVGWLVLVIG
jgi:hypothetical protein